MTAKAKRLSKVAKELNVGTSTIIDFLTDKGIEIKSNPNAKIAPDQYEMLLEKFQPDMLVRLKKEEALVQAEKDRAEIFGKKESITTPEPKPAPVKAEEEVILIKSNVIDKQVEKEEKVESEVKTQEIEDDTPAVVETKEEPVVEEVVVQTPVEPEIIEEKPVDVVKEEVQVPEEKVVIEEKKEDEPTKPVVEVEDVVTKEETEKPKTVEVKPEVAKTEEAKEEKGGLKVLGKIEIEDPKKKKKAQKEKQKDNEAVENSKKDEKPAEVKEQELKEKGEKPVVSEGAPPETPTTDATEAQGEDGEHVSWKEKREELKGLNVLGKIDLAKVSPKKKEDKKPRKRKLIKGSKAVSSTDDKEKLTKANRDNRVERPHGAGGQRGGNQGNRSGGGRPQTGGRPGDRNQNQRKRKRVEKVEINEKEIQTQIKETLNRLTGKDAKSAAKTKLKKKKKDLLKQKKESEIEAQEGQQKIVEVTEFITANELASLMDVSVTQVITACMSLGMMVSINQRIDAETIQLVADEFGFEAKFKDVEMDEPSLEEDDDESRMQSRPPIVTIMGHVDHGKTSLLDYIRKSNVIGGEAGGITQHIGAYEVTTEDGKQITFLDTPGHEAFTAMRARGAKVTDIVIVVIAADDKVMPQTKEAISHAQAAGVPIVFAINKVDREVSNPDLIKQQLSELNILVEDWGGKFQSQEISAKTGLNVNELLEKVLLEAELLELKADAEKRAVGTIIEAWMDKGRGVVSTVLVQSGTLRVGDNILAGADAGKVKAMTNERGQRVKEAGPATPVQVLGFAQAPTSGDKMYVTKNEAEAKQIATDRTQLIREQGIRATKHITLDEIGRRIAVGNFKELNVIVKGDVDGSVEALSDSLLKLTTPEIQVNVILKGVGQISESDVNLASASDAVIIGFQVRPSGNARMMADKEQIDIRLYSVIYDAIEELKMAMEGMLEPTTEEKVTATVEIRETFRITKVGTIAGCMVTSGKISRNDKVRLIREGVVKFDGELASLKRFKDDVKEVAKGYECGLNLEKYNEIEIGDIVEAYELVEVKRKL